jgi:hypothetical protein
VAQQRSDNSSSAVVYVVVVEEAFAQKKTVWSRRNRREIAKANDGRGRVQG